VAGQEKASTEEENSGGDAVTAMIFGTLALLGCVAIVLGIAAFIAIAVLAPHARRHAIKSTTMTAIDPVGELFIDETPVPVGNVITGATSPSGKHHASPAGIAAMHWRSATSPKPKGRRSSFAAEMNPLAAAQAARAMMAAKKSKESGLATNPMRQTEPAGLSTNASGFFDRATANGERKESGSRAEGGALSRLRRAGKQVVAQNKASAADDAVADHSNPMRTKKRRGSTFGKMLRRASFGATNPIAAAKRAARDAADVASVPDTGAVSLGRARRVSFVQQNPFAAALAAQAAEAADKAREGAARTTRSV
jgi:hypothetical protein